MNLRQPLVGSAAFQPRDAACKMAANYRIKFMFADAVTCEEEFSPQTTVGEAKTKLIGSSWPQGWPPLPPSRNTRPAGAGTAAHQRWMMPILPGRLPCAQAVSLHVLL